MRKALVERFVILDFFTVTEEEFLTLAESLRPWIQRSMKIEVAPWIRDYVVDMQDLYCELILEEISYKPCGQIRCTVDHYEILFYDHAEIPNKILAKGDTGIGKTTLAKKIAWDWANKRFSKVSLVLFVFLKSVRPNDSLEEAILEQMPELVGLGITQSKLESFIEHFGRKCLLILDGIDEHALGSNNDVLKILKHEKYLNCNVFLTSRPHSTIKYQQKFDTIVSVEGFTRSEARKFACCVVQDEKLIEQIIDFNPTGGNQDVPLCKCPILLSFICILVREKALDLSHKTMPTGEIYTRMIQCLYKKFTIRRGIRYDVSEFTKVVGLVGKLALETLLSNRPFFERSRVEREVGRDAFDYGFLIGQEDLIGVVKADILITFPHRSIQEFFGAFFFVLQLIEGSDIYSILGASDKDAIFLKNPLFLHFTFWLLSESCGEEYFTLSNTRKACEILHSYIYDTIHRQLGTRRTTEIFPAFDFKKALDTKDNINIDNFERILKRFHQIKYLTVVDHVVDDDVDHWILNHILPTCNALQVVAEGESLHCVLPKLIKGNGNNVIILLSERAYRAGILTSLLQKAVQFDKKPIVYLFLTEGESIDISRLCIRKFINCMWLVLFR